MAWAQSFWDLLSVMACTVLFLGVIVGIIYGVIVAVETIDFTKYEHSRKWNDIRHLLQSWGIKIKVDMRSIWDSFKSEFISAAWSILSITEEVVLTLLMFFFYLIAMVPGLRIVDAAIRRG